MMDKNEIIERLERLARCAIHTVGELPFVMSLDDGIAVHEAIEMLRSQTDPHWIPCSERLPEKNGFYLCTTQDCITILEFIEGNPHYHEEPSFVSDVLGKCNSYVVAWMHLPEPYEDVALHDYFPVSEAERRNWIPCSERLPKEKGLYWVTVKDKHEEGIEFLYSEQREWLGKMWSELSCVHCGVETITAWMPCEIPKPYREG